jgi:O-antigen/teichoic acid export membrane protein
VRQPNAPEERDRRVLFTFQSGLCAGLALCAWLAAPVLARAYGRAGADAWVFRLVALAVALVPLQTIPALQLERALDFGRLGMVEAAQAVTLNAGLLLVAWSRGPVWAFGLAFAARGLVGSLLAQAACPWRPAWAWDRARLASHLRFGLPYQGATLVSIAKDAIAPVMIGLTAGAAAVGLVSWAQTLAAFPVWALMPFGRLYLPAFARLQGDPPALARLVERVVRGANLVVAPLAVVTLALAEPITRIVFGETWLPALPLLFLLWTANLWVATATPLLGLLSALGRARTAFAFAVAWMLATWLLGAPLILALGPVGYGLANVVVQLVNLALFREARRLLPLRLLRAAAPPWAAAGLVGLLLHAISRTWPPQDLPQLALFLLAPLVVYALALAGFTPAAWRRAGVLLKVE